MTVARGRILRAGTFEGLRLDVATMSRASSGAPAAVGEQRRMEKSELTARRRAEAIIEEARKQAEDMIAAAKVAATEAATTIADEAEEHGRAQLASAVIAVRRMEDQRAVRERGLLEAIAIAMAERVVGVVLAEDPSMIAAIAARALEEARGARRVVFEVAKESELPLLLGLEKLAQRSVAIEVVPNAELDPGDVILRTDIGVMDGRLRVQLRRLLSAIGDIFTSAES